MVILDVVFWKLSVIDYGGALLSPDGELLLENHVSDICFIRQDVFNLRAMEHRSISFPYPLAVEDGGYPVCSVAFEIHPVNPLHDFRFLLEDGKHRTVPAVSIRRMSVAGYSLLISFPHAPEPCLGR